MLIILVISTLCYIKGDDKMLDFDENNRKLVNLKSKVEKIGESL